MKALFARVLAVTVFSVASGVACAQTWQQAPANADPAAGPQTPQGATMSQPTPITQPAMSRPGYYENDATGTQPGGSSGSGRGRDGARCTVGLSCDIYRGS